MYLNDPSSTAMNSGLFTTVSQGLSFWPWLAAIPIVYMVWNWLGPAGLRQVPTMGTSIPILAYLSGLRYNRNARETLLSGYAKYAHTTGVFKVAMPDQWLVVVAGPKQLEEVKKMTDDQVSNYGGVDELLAARFILGQDVVNNPYHMPLIHNKLTRNLSDFHGIMKDEMWTAFDDYVGSPTEYKAVPALKTVMSIISRVSNRVFVGLPLCRDPEFLSIATNVTLDIAKSRFVINLFPPFMKPLIAKFVNQVPSRLEKAVKLLGPMVAERRNRAEECKANKEEWEDKPNDFLMWLVDVAVENGYTNENSILYLLLIEFVALHTAAMSFTHALYYLAADPSLAGPMRAEVEAVLKEENGDIGSRTAVSKLKYIDSFLRESQRLNGTNATTVWRRTLQTITFSTGITVPAGVFLSAPATATHLDEIYYSNPSVFDPWRFVGVDSARSFVSSSPDFIAFGQGRHACPGRHFAAYEMKLMLAYIVLSYDVMMQPNAKGFTGRPENQWIGNSIIPDRNANVLFKTRQSA